MRLGHCMINLENYKKAMEAFLLAENILIEAGSLQKKEEIHGLIELCLSKNLEDISSSSQNINGDDIVLPEPYKGFNTAIPHASSDLCIVQDPTKGRCIYTKNGVKAGDVLFSELAYALVLNQQEEQRRCHFCADALIAPIPCPYCTEALYCSRNCLEEAWKIHHSFECGYRIVGSLGWSPRLTLRVLLRGEANFVEKAVSSEKDNSETDNTKPCSTSNMPEDKKLYLNMYGLISNREHEEPLKIFQFVVVAVILAHFLNENTRWKTIYKKYFTNISGSREILELLSIIALRHISQVAANNFLVRDLWTDEDNLLKIGWRNQGAGENPSLRVGQRQDEVASAIYLSSSILNHSCKPNSSHSYFKQHLIVKATEDIPEGKEVCIHYGQEYTRASRKDRMSFLKENCYFDCECEACSNPSQFNSQKSRAYCCPKCKGPLVLVGEEEEEDLKCEMKCLDCEEELNRKEYFDNGVDSGYFRYFKGMKILQANNVENALWNFLECKRILEKFLYCHNISLAKVYDRIAFCHTKQDKYEEALPFLSDSIAILEKNFGTESMEVAFELQKMVELLLASMSQIKDENLKRDKYQQAISIMERARKILEIKGGHWLHAFKELDLAKQKLDLCMRNK